MSDQFILYGPILVSAANKAKGPSLGLLNHPKQNISFWSSNIGHTFIAF